MSLAPLPLKYSERSLSGQTELQRLTRFYALLSQVNQSMLHSRSQQELFDRICRVAVAAGGFKLAWIGWLTPGSDLVQPVASAGDGSDYLETIAVSRQDSPASRGAIATAVQAGVVVAINNFGLDVRAAAWRDAAGQFGLAACAAAPIRVAGQIAGVLVIYSGEPEVFGTSEIALFDEIAADLSFALESMRARTKLVEQGALLDTANDAMMVCDLAHRVSYWNQGAERLYGLSAGEAENQRVEEIIPTVAFAPDIDYQSALSTGAWSGEVRRMTRAGQPVTVFSRWTLIRDELGRPKSLFGIETDISEKKELESQFLRAQRLESVGQLAGGVAHDLNNVLAPILIGAQLLSLDATDADKIELLTTIEASAKRGAEIVGQILRFARGGGDEMHPLSPVSLLSEVARLVRGTFPPRISLDTAFPPDLWSVNGDATQLHQLLMNLCVNARDAMPCRGYLRIAAENLVLDDSAAALTAGGRPGRFVVWTVGDTGSGIAPEHLERIFEPFFTTKAPELGTGLGLSTVAGIVRAHHGFIKIESKLDHGTQFRVYLPALEAGPVRLEEAVSPEQGHAGNGECILLVDDEAGVRLMTQRVLERAGYRVLLANDGAEALGVVNRRGGEIQIVVTDLMMPAMDGLSLCRILTRVAPHLKLITCSGMNERPGGAPPTPGLSATLRKPLSRSELLTTVRAVLQGRAAGASPNRETA